jgi:hypothetical protein
MPERRDQLPRLEAGSGVQDADSSRPNVSRATSLQHRNAVVGLRAYTPTTVSAPLWQGGNAQSCLALPTARGWRHTA